MSVVVERWLRDANLERYHDVLDDNEFDTLEAVAEITQEDLTNMAITKPGARRKFLASVHALRNDLERKDMLLGSRSLPADLLPTRLGRGTQRPASSLARLEGGPVAPILPADSLVGPPRKGTGPAPWAAAPPTNNPTGPGARPLSAPPLRKQKRDATKVPPAADATGGRFRPAAGWVYPDESNPPPTATDDFDQLVDDFLSAAEPEEDAPGGNNNNNNTSTAASSKKSIPSVPPPESVTTPPSCGDTPIHNNKSLSEDPPPDIPAPPLVTTGPVTVAVEPLSIVTSTAPDSMQAAADLLAEDDALLQQQDKLEAASVVHVAERDETRRSLDQMRSEAAAREGALTAQAEVQQAELDRLKQRDRQLTAELEKVRDAERVKEKEVQRLREQEEEKENEIAKLRQGQPRTAQTKLPSLDLGGKPSGILKRRPSSTTPSPSGTPGSRPRAVVMEKEPEKTDKRDADLMLLPADSLPAAKRSELNHEQVMANRDKLLRRIEDENKILEVIAAEAGEMLKQQQEDLASGKKVVNIQRRMSSTYEIAAHLGVESAALRRSGVTPNGYTLRGPNKLVPISEAEKDGPINLVTVDGPSAPTELVKRKSAMALKADAFLGSDGCLSPRIVEPRQTSLSPKIFTVVTAPVLPPPPLQAAHPALRDPNVVVTKKEYLKLMAELKEAMEQIERGKPHYELMLENYFKAQEELSQKTKEDPWESHPDDFEDHHENNLRRKLSVIIGLTPRVDAPEEDTGPPPPKFDDDSSDDEEEGEEWQPEL